MGCSTYNCTCDCVALAVSEAFLEGAAIFMVVVSAVSIVVFCIFHRLTEQKPELELPESPTTPPPEDTTRESVQAYFDRLMVPLRRRTIGLRGFLARQGAVVSPGQSSSNETEDEANKAMELRTSGPTKMAKRSTTPDAREQHETKPLLASTEGTPQRVDQGEEKPSNGDDVAEDTV